MKFSILASLTAAITFVYSVPVKNGIASDQFANKLLGALQSQAATFSPDVSLRVRSPSPFPTYLELPDGCFYTQSNRNWAADVNWVKDRLAEIKNDPDGTFKGVHEGDYNKNEVYNQISLGYPVNGPSTHPAVKKRDVASAIEKVLSSCSKYAPKGTVGAWFYLPTLPGSPSLFIAGQKNWKGYVLLKNWHL